MTKTSKLRIALLLIGIVMVIVGFILHFYYGPVYVRWAVIGGLMFFLGILIFVILIILSIVCRVRKGIEK